jgi:peptidoglycan-associated lipoprotein
LLDRLVTRAYRAAAKSKDDAMKVKVFALMAALAVLGACSQTPANTGATTGTGLNAATGAVVPGSQQDLAANVGDRVFFAFDQSSLSDDARATLDRQAAWLARYPQVTVQMAGNCDERGTEEYNLALGQRRANAARDYLVARGVSSARVTTISYGKERPVAPGSDEQAYAQNRNAITAVR